MDLISKYKANYHLDIPITEEMIQHHWNLERQLTKELLTSSPENRWEIFEQCYNCLYNELPWLNITAQANIGLYRDWAYLIGSAPQKIYEIGSGQGRLIKYLANLGHQCKATEITHERGKRFDLGHRISWGISDGVHLGRFETERSYDVVISDNVIEHLHPDDLIDHFRGVLNILVPGGRCIFRTPHAYIGPSDISGIFGCDHPQGMHLKEYTYKEIRSALKSAGFNEIHAVWNLPYRVRYRIKPMQSRIYLSYLCQLERLIARIPHEYTRKAIILSMALMFQPTIFIVASRIGVGVT
jgi:SAM-dependent methyltransferase